MTGLLLRQQFSKALFVFVDMLFIFYVILDISFGGTTDEPLTGKHVVCGPTGSPTVGTCWDCRWVEVTDADETQVVMSSKRRNRPK